MQPCVQFEPLHHHHGGYIAKSFCLIPREFSEISVVQGSYPCKVGTLDNHVGEGFQIHAAWTPGSCQVQKR